MVIGNNAQFGTQGLQYVDRGAVAGAFDFTSFTTNGVIQTSGLDLSSIIPVNTKLVDIYVEVADDAANSAFWFDKPGRLSTYRHYGSRTQVAAAASMGINLTVPVVNQALDYYFDNLTYITTRLTVLGWWI